MLRVRRVHVRIAAGRPAGEAPERAPGAARIRGLVVGTFGLILLLMACGNGADGQEARVVRPVEGPETLESLVEIKPDWTIVFRQKLKRRSVPVRELVTWGVLRDRSAGAHVVLEGGSVLIGRVAAIDRDFVTVSGRLWPEVTVPRKRIRGIVLRPPLDLLERDLLFKRISMEDRTGDVLLLDNGDQLSGRLFSDVRAVEGGTQIDTIPWSVPRSTQPISIPMSRVVAMLFTGSSREKRLGDPRVLIGFSDGSRLYAERIARQNDGLRIGLCDGMEVRCERTLPASEGPWQDIVMLQPMASRAIYMSDLEPLGHKHVPLFDLDWPYFRDANVAGGKLRHGGLMFRKGIGMHSTSRLAYELTEPYKWFEADLAIDERAGREGSVVFRVYLQEEGSDWSKAYESSVVRGAEQKVAMRVDIRGAVRLALIVDAADRLQVWDHANWLNARLVK